MALGVVGSRAFACMCEVLGSNPSIRYRKKQQQSKLRVSWTSDCALLWLLSAQNQSCGTLVLRFVSHSLPLSHSRSSCPNYNLLTFLPHLPVQSGVGVRGGGRGRTTHDETAMLSLNLASHSSGKQLPKPCFFPQLEYGVLVAPCYGSVVILFDYKHCFQLPPVLLHPPIYKRSYPFICKQEKEWHQAATGALPWGGVWISSLGWGELV